MPATLTRARNFDQHRAVFGTALKSRSHTAGTPPPKQRCAAVRNRPPSNRPPAGPEAAHVPDQTPSTGAGAQTPCAAVVFPATDIYSAHPMLRNIANLEARLARAAWAEAECCDQAISVRSGFRFVAQNAGACATAPTPRPSALDAESDKALDIAVGIHQARLARGLPDLSDRTWYREGLVRQAMQQLGKG